MRTSPRFWNRIAQKYARDPIANPGAYARKLAMTRAHFTPESEVLEVGCGTGSTALLHAPHVRHILATDFSDAMLAIARDKAAAQGIGNVTFQCTRLEDLNEGPRFDVVMAMSLIHLLPDPEAGVKRMAGLLKPGGRLVSSTASLSGWTRAIAFVSPLLNAFGLIPLVHALPRDRIRAMMEGAGLTVETDWKPEGKGTHAVFMIARKPG